MTQERVFDEMTVHCFVSATDSVEDRPHYLTSQFGDQQPGWVKVHTEVFHIPRPTREELIPQQIAQLEAEMAKARAEAEERCQKCQQAINKLLALTMEDR